MFQWFVFFPLVLCLDGMQKQMTLAYFAANITICITTTFTLSMLRGFFCAMLPIQNKAIQILSLFLLIILL